MDWSRVPLLLVTAGLLIGGLTEKTSHESSQVMTAVGFVMLGAWATIEIQTWYQRLRQAWERDEKLTFEQEIRNYTDPIDPPSVTEGESGR